MQLPLQKLKNVYIFQLFWKWMPLIWFFFHASLHLQHCHMLILLHCHICYNILAFILLCCLTSSSGAAPLTSPQSISSDASKKHSPRVVRQLKTSPRFLEPTISSSKLATKPPKERSPRVSDHNSPSSLLSEVHKITSTINFVLFSRARSRKWSEMQIPLWNEYLKYYSCKSITSVSIGLF